MRWITACLLSLGVLAVAGCASPSLSGDVYSRSDAGRAMRAHDGEVLGLRRVAIEGEPTALGTSGGGLVGYSLGRVPKATNVVIFLLCSVSHFVLVFASGPSCEVCA